MPQVKSHSEMKKLGQTLAAAGDGKDEHLVHMSEEELNMLRHYWGEPGSNSKTGLPSYSWLSKAIHHPTQTLKESINPALALDKGGSAEGGLGSQATDLVAGLQDAAVSGGAEIKKNPWKLFTGIDPASTELWNLILGRNDASLVNAFGSPSNTTWERTQADNPDQDFTRAKDFTKIGDTIAGIYGGSAAYSGLSKAYGAASLGTGGAAGSGAGTVGAGGTEAGSGLAAGSAGSAGAVGAADAAIPTVTVTGTAGGVGGGLGGSSLGASLAGGVGVDYLNSLGSSAGSSGGESSFGPDTPTDTNLTPPSDSVWDNITNNFNWTDAYKVGSSLYGLYSSIQQKNSADAAMKASDPFGPYRKYYGDALLQLMANPSKVEEDPGYKFQRDAGEQALVRSMAAKGFLGSGNLGTALVKYNQDFASNYLMTRENQLATLAGANIAPNFGPALNAQNLGIETAGSALRDLGYTLGSTDWSWLSKIFGTGG